MCDSIIHTLKQTFFNKLSVLGGGLRSSHPLRSGTKAIGDEVRDGSVDAALQGWERATKVRHGVGQLNPVFIKLVSVLNDSARLLYSYSIKSSGTPWCRSW